MARLIESSLWLDFTRRKSPVVLKRPIEPWILVPSAALCAPVIFEILRHATGQELPLIEAPFATYPVHPAPHLAASHAAGPEMPRSRIQRRLARPRHRRHHPPSRRRNHHLPCRLRGDFERVRASRPAHLAFVASPCDRRRPQSKIKNHPSPFLSLQHRDGSGFRWDTLSGPDATLDLPGTGISITLTELYRDVD